MRPLVISHAACGGHAPENTLAGIHAALSFGVDAIEIDVQSSADGVPVLIHDLTVDRTTNGTGAVADLTLAELRALDAGGEPVPTLDEVLGLIVDNALLVIEIKQPGIEGQIAAVVRARDAVGDTMIWSFFPEALEAMRNAEPRLPAGLLVAPQSLAKWPELRELAVRTGLQAVGVFHPGVNDALARDCQCSGLALYAWTADSKKDIARLIDLGVDGICSNFPDKVVTLLAAHAG